MTAMPISIHWVKWLINWLTIFFNMEGGGQHTTPADPGLPKHHATKPIVLAVTQCVGCTTNNLGHTMHHVDLTTDE